VIAPSGDSLYVGHNFQEVTMSFSKSIQSLRALTEAPLPPLMDPKILYPEKQTNPNTGKEYYDAKPVFGKIDKIDKKEKDRYGLNRLGEGSSRVAVTLRVSANEFTSKGKKTLQSYGVKPSGIIKTVIKLALNPQGVAQNASEIRAWEKTKSRLFVPVLDHSALNKREASVEVNGEPVPPQYSNWIQTIEVKPFKNSGSGQQEWFGELKKFFGVPGGELSNAFGAYSRDYAGFSKAIESWDRRYGLSSDQKSNLEELVRASKGGEMVMGDLYQPANWGMLGDRMFVIDYGFDVASSKSYTPGQLDIEINIGADGMMMVDFKGEAGAVALAREKLKPS